MIKINESNFFKAITNVAFIDEQTAYQSLLNEVEEGKAIDQQLYAQMLGWA